MTVRGSHPWLRKGGLFPDWDVSMARQARSLDVLVRRHLGPGARRILDCACGIGTQSIGPALAATGSSAAT